MADQKTFSDLKKQLQRTFILLKQYRNDSQEIETIARPCIKTVANLTEQLGCCSAVKLSSLPQTIDSSDVKQKLLFKISSEINENIVKIQTQVCRYEEIVQRLGRQYDQCVTLYNKCCNTQLFTQLLERSPLTPSITDMLEWLEISERLCRESYLCKKFIINTFNPDQPGVTDNLVSSWQEGDKDLYNTIDEYIALTYSFVELEVT